MPYQPEQRHVSGWMCQLVETCWHSIHHDHLILRDFANHDGCCNNSVVFPSVFILFLLLLVWHNLTIHRAPVPRESQTIATMCTSLSTSLVKCHAHFYKTWKQIRENVHLRYCRGLAALGVKTGGTPLCLPVQFYQIPSWKPLILPKFAAQISKTVQKGGEVKGQGRLYRPVRRRSHFLEILGNLSNLHNLARLVVKTLQNKQVYHIRLHEARDGAYICLQSPEIRGKKTSVKKYNMAAAHNSRAHSLLSLHWVESIVYIARGCHGSFAAEFPWN